MDQIAKDARRLATIGTFFIVAGWVFVALHTLRELSLALILYSPNSRVLSLFMWDSWANGAVPVAAAIGVLLMVATGAIVVLGRMVDQQRSRKHAGM